MLSVLLTHFSRINQPETGLSRNETDMLKNTLPASVSLRQSPLPALPAEGPPVAILLSLFNGETYLPQQLISLLNQHYPRWTLIWRDDGSSDASRAILRDFASGDGAGRCTEVDCTDSTNLGVAASYWRLLEHAPADHVVAFADQDDVWLPEKLTRAVAALSTVPDTTPGLYCSRQILTDSTLRPLRVSPRLPENYSIFSALTGNIATGCTVVINRATIRLLDALRPPPDCILHDWATCLAVAANGGIIRTDNRPSILYRQHADNAVGAPSSWARRACAAVRRGPGTFMQVFRTSLNWLISHRAQLPPQTAEKLDRIQLALSGTAEDRLRVLKDIPELTRSGASEALLFRLWFLLG